MHVSGLATRIDRELSLPNYYAILVNALTSFNLQTDIAQILQYEVIQTVGGYQPQPFLYTQNSSTYNAVTGWQVAPDAVCQFTDPLNGTGYDYTHVVLIQGRSAGANKIVNSVNFTTDLITVNSHGLVTGDRVFIRSTGARPTGLEIQRYYASVVNSDSFELYSNPELTNKVDFTDNGSGTLYLQYANGVVFDWEVIPGRINPGSPKSFIISYQVQ